MLVEKKLVLDLDEAQRALRACREAGVILMTANRDRFELHARAVKRIIDAGLLGDVTLVLERQAGCGQTPQGRRRQAEGVVAMQP